MVIVGRWSYTDTVYSILLTGHAASRSLSPTTKYPKIALVLLSSNLDLKNCLQQFRYNLDLPLSQPHDFHGRAEQKKAKSRPVLAAFRLKI